MYRWRISLFGKTPARYLGTLSAPSQAAAIEKGVEFFGISEEQRFRLVAEQIIEAGAPTPLKSWVEIQTISASVNGIDGRFKSRGGFSSNPQLKPILARPM